MAVKTATLTTKQPMQAMTIIKVTVSRVPAMNMMYSSIVMHLKVAAISLTFKY